MGANLTWFLRKESELALTHAEMRMVRWMCMIHEIDTRQVCKCCAET